MMKQVEGKFIYHCARLVFVTSERHMYKASFHLFTEIVETVPLIKDNGEIIYYDGMRWFRVKNRQIHTWESQKILGTVDEDKISPVFAEREGFKGYLIKHEIKSI